LVLVGFLKENIAFIADFVKKKKAPKASNYSKLKARATYVKICCMGAIFRRIFYT